MIKFFQKLKAKKGFTLVELIVVIAIIGVLAAILVPTMLGYVTNSRVTSADTTAASIEDSIDNFLTTADTKGYGMLQATTNVASLTGTIAADGKWTITQTGGSFKTGASLSWGSTSAAKVADDTKVGLTEALDLLAIELANLFPDLKNACFEASLVGGDCATVWYTADTATVADVSDLTGGAYLTNGKWTAETFDWDTKTEGISVDGYIVGTSPKLLIG